MTLFAYLNGSDVGTKIRLNAFGLTTRADGQPGVGGIIFDDPVGNMNVRGWMSVVVKEFACTSAPVLFTGYIADRIYSRSSGDTTYKTGASRFIDSNLIDQNALMHTRDIEAATGQRGVESEAARIAWVLANYLPGVIDDGEINSSTSRSLDSADYRGKYADDVLNDLVNTWIFFLYPTQPAGTPALFYNFPTATVRTSTLTISNDPADLSWDSNRVITGTCYPPSMDAALRRDPSEVFSRMRLTYRDGVQLRSNDTTLATYFTDNGIGHRGLVYDTSRVTSQATAISYADRMLARDSTEHDKITVTVQLPDSKVGLIDAGMRIGVKFTHLEGYTTLSYTRVTARTVKQAPGTNVLYDVTLELDRQGRAGGGVGTDPGSFPTPPTPAPVHFYSGSLTFYSDGYGYGGGPGTGLSLDTTILSSNRAICTLAVGVTYNIDMDMVVTGGDNPPQMGLIDVASGFHRLQIDNVNPIVGATYTNTSGIPQDIYAYASVGASGHVPKVTTFTWTIDPVGWDPGGTPIAPISGQWVYGENLSMSGAVGTTVWPYAAGSTRVKVDGVLISPASYVETDPAAGTITLSWTPDTDEVVTIDYQGI